MAYKIIIVQKLLMLSVGFSVILLSKGFQACTPRSSPTDRLPAQASSDPTSQSVDTQKTGRDQDSLRVQSKRRIAKTYVHAWDKNGDGVVSASEFPYSALLFSTLAGESATSMTEPEFINKFDVYRTWTQSTMEKEHGWFHVMDRNGDSVVTCGEMGGRSDSAAIMGSYDLNRDGKLTLSELDGVASPPHQWKPIMGALRAMTDFPILDGNRDGKLDQKELGSSAFLIRYCDEDNDGRVDRQELEIAQQCTKEGPALFRLHYLGVLFRRLDKNNSGFIAKNEIGKYARAFQYLDSDKNGVVTKDEFLRFYDIRDQMFKRTKLNSSQWMSY